MISCAFGRCDRPIERKDEAYGSADMAIFLGTRFVKKLRACRLLKARVGTTIPQQIATMHGCIAPASDAVVL